MGGATGASDSLIVVTPQDMPLQTYRGAVASWECDPNGHMNVRHYVAKFDDATWHFSECMGIGGAYLAREGCGFMAVDQHIQYRRELMPPDALHIVTDILDVADRKMQFHHTMYHTRSGAIAAVCTLLGVHVDLSSRKAVPIPETTRLALSACVRPASEKLA